MSTPRRCPPPSLPAACLPRDGVDRTVMLALRFVAAAAETGDAACFDAAFDGAEAALGPRDGALLVARAATLVRALRREDSAARFLPPPCRHLSPGEAELLAALRLRSSGGRLVADAGSSGATLAALADLAAPAGLGPPLLPTPQPPACPALRRAARP